MCTVPTVAAGDERQLDADLSLTGGCTVPEELDPVQDPGCPENPPATTNHPPAPFARPMAVATDFYGNIYVSNWGKKDDGTEGRIDIFGPDGVFVTEVKSPPAVESSPSGEARARAKGIAVDSDGTLYLAVSEFGGVRVVRFSPGIGYDPAAGEISYPNPPELVHFITNAFIVGLAINPQDDHLFVHYARVIEFDSAAEGNDLVGETEVATFGFATGVAVDAARHRLYASHEESQIDIFDLEQVNGSNEYVLTGTIEGSEVPAGAFVNFLSVAVDEGTGHILVLDGDVNKVYEFDEDGTYLATLEHGFQTEDAAQIGIDNGPNSPNGALNPDGRYLFVPSHRTGAGHSFAFAVSAVTLPGVESVSAGSIGEEEAELQAIINPGSLATTYTFEYMTQQAFEDAGETFTGATVAGSGDLPATNADTEAAVTVVGLQSGTRYQFRVLATNSEGSDEEAGSFTTYPTQPVEPVACSNRDLRIGLSKLLPDCRAYELVTPADSNARAPSGSPITNGANFFTNHQVSPAGDKIPWVVEGGSLPGEDGTGSLGGDPYLSSRGPDGWSSAYIGPSGSDTNAVFPGGTSPDQGYSFWISGTIGPASIGGALTSYVRYPDGHSEVLGAGSLGTTDPRAVGRLISEDGDHMIFNTGSAGTAVQLEPQAAPNGTDAIYDRAPTGELRVISLLPESVPFGGGDRAIYAGASLDGKGVAFLVNSTLYFRYDNSETYEVGAGVEFAGIAEGGNRIFYLEGGRLWRLDALTGDRTAFSAGTVTPVNVSADGSAAYFVSKSVLTTDRNPNDAKAKNGKSNLYLSREGEISFVGTLTDRDVAGEEGEAEQVDGLGLWMVALGTERLGYLGLDPSRSTPDGGILLFESGAALAGYDPEGHQQVYRYDSVANELECLSCNPTGAAATGRARLQSVQREGSALFSPRAVLTNLRADGRRAFFESTEALVAGDTDGLQDVYEWEDQGVGSCTAPGGCVYLISSGHSFRNDYLWAVSESGDDVFFLTADLVLPADADETPSIYDARVGGGFPEPGVAECQGEGCRPQLQPPPLLTGTHTPPHGAGDNIKPRRCPKGKHKVKRAGKVRCVKNKKHKRGATNRKGAHR
jgi:hypothetical protein